MVLAVLILTPDMNSSRYSIMQFVSIYVCMCWAEKEKLLQETGVV